MTRLIFRRGCYLKFQSERVETGILRGSLISSARMSDGCASKFHQGLAFPQAIYGVLPVNYSDSERRLLL